ncbi:MAG: phosphatidylinositol-specific phospholipase C domain-containing protein [Clostridia bacterium]|nr:phosphatidylinositol-specific phospholipase C domain-containing protein [Clostridia bacterium]
MKLKSLIIVAIIAVVILALGLGFGLNAKNALDTSEAEPWLSEWMSRVRDDVRVNHMVIPGSHDAGTYDMMWMAETQNRTIKEQLASGSRYFDLRVWKTKGDYVIFHGPIKGARFEPILDDINAFLTAHPSEFLILDFQKFKGDSQADVIEMLSTKLGDKILKNNTLYGDLDSINTLTVGEARGKCIIVWGDAKTANSADFLFLRNNDKGTRSGSALSSFYFRKYNTLASKDYIKKGLSKYLEMHEENPNGLFVLQCQLTDPVFVIGPKALEAMHNKNMSDYINSFDTTKHQLNIVMRDYIGPKKCQEIIALNRAYGNFKPEYM